MIAPVGAIAAAKVLPVGYVESARTKLMRWFHADAPPMKIDPKPAIYGTSFCEGQQWHQEQLSKWLANKVDEAVFNTIRKVNE